MVWTCRSCAGANPDGTRFCGHCGRPGTGADPSVPGPSPGTPAGLVEVGEAAFLTPEVAERLTAGSTEGVEEHRIVTVLFADVAGLSELADGLDAGRLVGIVDPLVAMISAVVGRYEGYVGKYSGDAMLAVFGAPVVHEDDPMRAVLAARAMQRELPQLLQSLPAEAHHLTLQIGINTGRVVAGFFGGGARMDYSVLGDAVNVAQRLETASPGGAVYVGDATYLLTRHGFHFEQVGDLVVKGKADPVRAWRLLGEAPERPVPALAREDRGAAGGIVGRGREVDALTEALGRVREHGALVALLGEPGVGKTRLFQEARAVLERSGGRWLEVRCPSYRSRPYWPYVQLLRSLAGIGPVTPAEEAARRLVEETARAGTPSAAAYFLRMSGLPVPADIPDVTPADPEAFRIGLQHAVVDYLAALGSDASTVLALEDVHWADEATAAMTEVLARAAGASRIGLALTSRPEGRPLIERWAAATTTPALSLEVGSLDRAGTAALASSVLGGEAPAALVDVLTARTAGNPLFIQEVVRSLLDTGNLVRGPGGWALRPGWQADAVPATVEKVLAARIDRLPRRAADLLAVASVIGRHIRSGLLRAAAPEAPAEEVDGLVQVLVDGGFLDRSGGFLNRAGGFVDGAAGGADNEGEEPALAFHHALVAEVAYGRMLRSRRREIHRRLLGVALELYGSGDDVIDLLARHAYLGGTGPAAVPYLSRAAERAAGLFANEQAITYLGQAVECAEDPGAGRDGAGAAGKEIPGLLLRLAHLEELTGVYAAALSHYAQVRTATADLRAFIGQASALRKLGEYDRCLEVLAEARAAHPRPDAEALAARALEEGWVLGVSGRYSEARAVLQEGLAAVAERGIQIEDRLLLVLARVEEGAGDFTAAATHADRARRSLEARGDVTLLPQALRVTGHASLMAYAGDPGRVSEAREMLERGIDLARHVGDAEEAAACLVNLGRVLVADGRSEEGIGCFEEAVTEFESVGIKAGVACGYANISEALLNVGRLTEAEEAARHGLTVAEEIAHMVWAAELRDNLAKIFFAQGAFEEAARTGAEAGEALLAIANQTAAAVSFDIAAESCRRLGDLQTADAWAARAAQARAGGRLP